MFNFCYHKFDFGLYVEWNFFVIDYDKSSYHDICSTSKKLVYKISLQIPFNKQILTPQSMYEFCELNVKGIH